MDATRLALTNPGALACALFILSALAAVLRARGRAPWRRWLWLPAVALGGALLVQADTAVSQAALVAAAVAAVLFSAASAYHDTSGRLSPPARVFCAALRALACCGLLLVIARPSWTAMAVEWERPLLVALLDQSDSMSIVDVGLRAGAAAIQAEAAKPGMPGATRAARARAALDASARSLAALNELYEVQVRSIGGVSRPLTRWNFEPAEPTTAIADALRGALDCRSQHGEAPIAVLAISDGAENGADAREVAAAAGALALQRVGLLTVGVGPDEGSTPAVVLEPLVVPASIGPRERLSVHVSGQVLSCGGHRLTLSALWDGVAFETRELTPASANVPLDELIDALAPPPGPHRLTVRATLPETLGGAVFEQEALIEVRDDAIRVLLLDGRPRPEFAFIARVLQGDARFEVAPRLLVERQRLTGRAIDWASYDAVLLGDVPRERFDEPALEALRAAVAEAGVGLFLAGGSDFFNSGEFKGTPLEAIVPCEFLLRRVEPGDASPLVPAPAGQRHPFFASEAGGGERISGLFKDLPPLSIAARLGAPRPLATLLAADQEGRPMLVVQEAGRGRVAAAAWSQTWPWALASDAGNTVHGVFWRQGVVWLANRRPQAWVLPDALGYAEAALASGAKRIRIRAGVRGGDAGMDDWRTQLRLKSPSGAASVVIPLRRGSGEWLAELPSDLPGLLLTGGNYEVEFLAAPARGDGAAARPNANAGAAAGWDGPEVLRAVSEFAVERVEAEHRPPTANLGLLRAAAERTAAAGGRYVTIGGLPELLERLGETDRRRRVERPLRFDPAGDRPLALWLWIATALSIEWAVRKRSGMP